MLHPLILVIFFYGTNRYCGALCVCPVQWRQLYSPVPWRWPRGEIILGSIYTKKHSDLFKSGHQAWVPDALIYAPSTGVEKMDQSRLTAVAKQCGRSQLELEVGHPFIPQVLNSVACGCAQVELLSDWAECSQKGKRPVWLQLLNTVGIFRGPAHTNKGLSPMGLILILLSTN